MKQNRENELARLEATLREEMNRFERLHDELRLAIDGGEYDRADKVSRQISQLLNMIQADLHAARHS
ncbi:MAG: hypothetical protein WBA12_11400 [Catalinimonas sp.]